jgi:hypothetical protein
MIAPLESPPNVFMLVRKTRLLKMDARVVFRLTKLIIPEEGERWRRVEFPATERQ